MSAVILWMTAEMTCACLVFCIPSAPKAFSKTGMPTRLATALQSWNSRLSSRLMRSSNNDNNNGQVSSSSHVGGRWLRALEMDPYQELPKTHLPVSEASRSFEAESSSARLSDFRRPSAGGIVMTTSHTVTTLQGGDHHNVAAEEYGRQHPW